MATTIASLLRSRGVSWLAAPLMSYAIPTLLRELLSLCGTMGLPATRPEVRSLRILWFSSFVVSKLALVPMWLRRPGSRLSCLHTWPLRYAGCRPPFQHTVDAEL